MFLTRIFLLKSEHLQLFRCCKESLMIKLCLCLQSNIMVNKVAKTFECPEFSLSFTLSMKKVMNRVKGKDKFTHVVCD